MVFGCAWVVFLSARVFGVLHCVKRGDAAGSPGILRVGENGSVSDAAFEDPPRWDITSVLP